MSGSTTTITMAPAELADQGAADRLYANVDTLRETGNMLHARGWSLGTSSNYSVVLRRDPLELLVTASGKDKGRLGRSDFVRVGADGRRAGGGKDGFAPDNKPSAETLLHVALAELPEVGAVLHTHSVWGTLLSEKHFATGGLNIEGYEMLKGLEGITSHETQKWVPIFDNTQDIPALAQALREKLHDSQHPLEHGFLIRKHGLYTWGRDLAAARRHIEIFEFLFECIGRLEFAR